jgi:hypothetical protein
MGFNSGFKGLNRRQWQTSCPGHITFRQSNFQYQLDSKLGGVEPRFGQDILEMKKISWRWQKSNPWFSGPQPGHFTDCDFPVAPLNLRTHCNVIPVSITQLCGYKMFPKRSYKLWAPDGRRWSPLCILHSEAHPVLALLPFFLCICVLTPRVNL